MKPATTIREIFSGKPLSIPNYQRAYSWDSPKENSERKTQVDTFLDDIDDHIKSKVQTNYYFGHFLFEDTASQYQIIDGQQRLTTIVICLSAIFAKIKTIRALTPQETEIQNCCSEFKTTDYDYLIFKDFVINRTKTDATGITTESAKRIIAAYAYFEKHFSSKDDEYVKRIVNVICDAHCTTHLVRNESEAIQMFIFHNNRGKKPTNLEILKAHIMYYVHLHGGKVKNSLLEELKQRFESIYKSISSIESRIDEDDVLNYTAKIHFNSLWESNGLNKAITVLHSEDQLTFVRNFVYDLADVFEKLKQFFIEDNKASEKIHSFISLGSYSDAIPFIIKSYRFNKSISEISDLCQCFESIILRHRIIGTRADIKSRLADTYKSYTADNSDHSTIIAKISFLKNTEDSWWSYWNNSELRRSLDNFSSHSIAKFILWKYENHIISRSGKSGYCPLRFDQITNPELEHIAPTKEPAQLNHGYDEYTEEFRSKYLNCLGNYLLLSKSHNCSVGNIPFREKLATYNHLAQQREIHEFCDNNEVWNRSSIIKRDKKIIDFVMEIF